jgi:hypothetical protein
VTRGGPDESGILPGSTLTTYTGNRWLNTNGASISNLHITGDLYITASNVTVTNCLVDGDVQINLTPTGGRVNPVPSNITLTRVDCTWFGTGGYNGLTLDRCNIHDVRNAANSQFFNDSFGGTAYPASNLTVKMSWIHGVLPRTNDAHIENLHLGGVQGALIQGNRFELYAPVGGSTDGFTANFMMEPAFRGVYNRDVVVDDNEFFGGSYWQVYLNGLGSNVLSNNAFHTDSPIYGGVIFPWGSYVPGTTPPGGWPEWTVSGNTLDGEPYTPSFTTGGGTFDGGGTVTPPEDTPLEPPPPTEPTPVPTGLARLVVDLDRMDGDVVLGRTGVITLDPLVDVVDTEAGKVHVGVVTVAIDRNGYGATNVMPGVTYRVRSTLLRRASTIGPLDVDSTANLADVIEVGEPLTPTQYAALDARLDELEATPPGSAADATTTTKGIVKLAGDLGGTAALPTVPGLADKAAAVHTHTASQVSDFTEATQDVVGAMVAAAGGSYNDGAGSITLPTVGGIEGPEGPPGADGADGAPGPAMGYPLSAYGLAAATFPLEVGATPSTVANLFAARVWVPAGTALTGGATIVTTNPGTGSGEVRFAVWEDNGTLAGSSSTDAALFNTLGWRSAAFTTPVAASGSDRFVWVGFMAVGVVGATIPYVPSAAGLNAQHRRCVYSDSLTTLPTTLDIAGLALSDYLPFVGLLS